MGAIVSPENAIRNAEIVFRRQRGEQPWQIVRAMNLTKGVVVSVCSRAGLTADDNRAAQVARYRTMGVPRHPHAKLSPDKVCEIRRRYVPGDSEQGGRALSAEFGVGRDVISAVVRRRAWAHVE